MTSPEPEPGDRRSRSRRPRVRIDLGAPLPFDEDPTDSTYASGGGPRRAAGGSSRLLVFGLVAVLAFAGGAAVQKRETKGYTAPADSLEADLEAQARDAVADRSRPPFPSQPAPSLVGTVVSLSGYTVVVRDAQGAERIVRAGEITSVRRKSSYGQLAVGQEIAVFGQLAPDGSVPLASEVVAH